MSGDARAFYKTWELGTLIKGPPRLEAVIETPSEPKGSLWADRGIVTPRGPAASTKITMPAVLWNTTSPYDWASIAAWHRVRARFIDDMARAAGPGYSISVYAIAGWLCWIENDLTDVTTPTALMADLGGGAYAVQVGLSDLPNLANGEYIYLRHVADPAYWHDVAEVTAIDRDGVVPGQTVIYISVASVITGLYDIGDMVAQVVQAWPNAYLANGITLEGVVPGSNKKESDVDVEFITVEESVP